ncbi:MAG: glutathione S-transferase family protein [Gammaproteobacteria bacterium]|nr:glutathione S-transferase family protein [Gammaproteobacteria bacterium]
MSSQSRPILVIGNKNYSSWSLRGWLALRRSGVDFEERRLPLDTPAFAAEIGALSPTRRVPVLWDGDLCIWDSLAIAEYANERWADGRLLPADPALRGRARSLCAEMHSGFQALRGAMPMNCRALGRSVPMTDELSADIRRVIDLWCEARAARAGAGPWLLGDFSLADLMYAPVVLRFRTYGVQVPDVARAYMDTLLEDADIVEWLAAAQTETEVLEAEEVG